MEPHNIPDIVSVLDQHDNQVGHSLLSTKLFIPSALSTRDVLPRPRLVQRLNTGLHRKLTFISAPAGFGTTTLLAEWIPQSERRVTCLSLDEADNDAVRFFAYVIATLRLLQADFGQPLLAALQSSQPPRCEDLMSTLVNEISRSLDEFVLVLEDYHVIQTQAIHDAMAFLLDHLPPHMHLIITSRTDPPLPLARLRARGQVAELGAADLRFTPEETIAFFHQVKELQLTEDQIQDLGTRTEGWAAGLQLAALSLQCLDAADVARFVHDFTGSNHYVFDYLAEEVLQQQPEEVRHFLLHTSILKRLSGPLCDAVLGIIPSHGTLPLRGPGGEGRDPGRGDQGSGISDPLRPDSLVPDAQSSGQPILEHLERANLFLVPLDEQRHWYRYHHLFADFLRERLARESGQAGLDELYRRASQWHEHHGSKEEALHYALAGQDWAGAARLVEQLTASLWQSSRYNLDWLETLPEEVVTHSPELGMWYAFSLMVVGDFSRVAKLLDAAEQAARSSGNLSELAGVYAYRAMAGYLRDDAWPTFENARQAMAYLDDSNRSLHALVYHALARGYFLRGEIVEAERAWAETIQVAGTVESQRGLLLVRAAQGELQRVRGKLRQAAQLEGELLQDISERPSDILKVKSLGHLAAIYYEWNQLDQAGHYARQAIELAGQTQREIFALPAYLVLTRIQQAYGEEDRASQTLEWAKALAQRLGGEAPSLKVEAGQVQLWLARHQAASSGSQRALAAAIDWAEAQHPDLDGELPHERRAVHVTMSRVFIAQNRPDAALRLLERLLAPAEATGRAGEMIELLALKALAHQAQNRTDLALTSLTQALALAEPEGYVRTFVDEGVLMARLLLALSRQPSALSRAYLDSLLAAFPGFKLPISESGSSQAAPPPTGHPESRLENLVETLSKRELEVLQLMAQGLTNGEIAEQLFVSAQTVKVHTRNIYGKLDVHNRRKAVAKARALGLLASP